MTLTPPGQAFVHHARAVLAQLENLTGDLQEYAKGIKGHLRIAGSTTALSESAPPVLSTFLRAHPDVNIDLRERLSHDIVRAVSGGQLDIGIVFGPVRTEALYAIPYRSDSLVLVVATSHPLAGEKGVPLIRTLDCDHVGLHEARAIHAFLTGGLGGRTTAAKTTALTATTRALTGPGRGEVGSRGVGQVGSHQRPRRVERQRGANRKDYQLRCRYSVKTISCPRAPPQQRNGGGHLQRCKGQQRNRHRPAEHCHDTGNETTIENGREQRGANPQRGDQRCDECAYRYVEPRGDLSVNVERAEMVHGVRTFGNW